MVLPTLNFLIISIARIGAIFTNIICLRQVDLKRLIAYSSIGHIRLLIIGVISNSKIGQYGSIVIMLTHGLTSSCLFLLKNFDLFKLKPDTKLGLNNILYNIGKAKNDDKIKGIYLQLTYIKSNFGGWATIEEIRNKLIDFKKSGKPIYAYGELGLAENAYYLASIADSIFLHPEAYLELNGLGGTLTFFTNTAKKLGIKPQVIRVGKYKAAVEPFTLNKMSRENRKQTTKYINSIWNHVLTNIANARKLAEDDITKLINKSPIHPAKDALDTKIIDGILYKDEVITLLRKKTNVKKNKKPRLVSLGRYRKTISPKKKKKAEKIAIVYAQGSIINSNKEKAIGEKAIGPKFAKTLRKLRENNKIKAVILRINSPGGSAITSDFIWREIELLKKKKPVIASMGNVAASGGYYIACAANKIIASDNTITGSIGVFGLLFSGKDFYEKKLHFSFDEIKTNRHANFMGGNPLGMPFSTRALNAEERKIGQKFVNKIYDTFISHVADGRNLSIEKVNEIGQGRVWVGKDALKLGLIDKIGGLEEAIALAKKEADLEICKIVEYPKKKDFIKQLLEDLQGSISEKILKKELGTQYPLYKASNEIIQMQGIQARLPYDIDIK